MNVVEHLIAFLDKPESKTKGQTPEGLCPICWGHQQYDQKIRDIYKDKQVDVANHKAKYTLIQDFVVNKLNGIRLKKGDGGHVHECPACSRHEKDPGQA